MNEKNMYARFSIAFLRFIFLDQSVNIHLFYAISIYIDTYIL